MRALVLVALWAAPVAADPLLDKIEATYGSAKQVTGAFTKSVENKTFNRTDETKGSFAVERPFKIEFDFVDKKGKPRSSFLFDGKTGWAISHMNHEFKKQALDAKDFPAAISFLTGKKGNLAKTHEVASNGNVLTLTPKVTSAAYSKLELELDSKTSTVIKSTVTTAEGVTTYTFSDVNLAAKVPADKFTFDPAKQPDYAPAK